MPSGRSEDHYWPEAEEQRSYRGYPPPTAALSRMRRGAEAKRARAVLAVGTPRGPREELSPRNPEIKTFKCFFPLIAPAALGEIIGTKDLQIEMAHDNITTLVL